MKEEGMVQVHEVYLEADAHIVVGFLEAQGIDAVISADDAGDQLPAFEPVRGVKIYVAAEDADRARRLIEARQTAGETE